jgi:hypothetical protein
LAPATRAELFDDLIRGYSVFILDEEVPSAWWRVEPGTADPVARAEGGWLVSGASKGAPGDLVPPCGELYRALADSTGATEGESVVSAIRTLFSRYYLKGTAPIAAVLSAMDDKEPKDLLP